MNIDWDKVIKIILAILAAAGFTFAAVKAVESANERKARIEAQNDLAEQAEVVKEKEGLWSKLSFQKDEVIEDLRGRNSDLASLIEDRDQRIYSLTETIAKIKPVRVVVRQENVRQSEEEGEDGQERARVDFEQTEDPVKVSGFTLTNPAEAELEVSFVRPLRLTTTVVQNEDGSFQTYLDSDWDNLEIENVETIVSLQETSLDREWYERIVFGAGLGIDPKFDGGMLNLYGLYDITDSISIGPSFGVSTGREENFFTVGANVQFRPF